MAVIKQDDLIQSVADALQFISYYHPVDFIQAMHEAYLREESPAARDSMAQILINSRMCATGHRPICQDTGIVTVFVRVGMDVRWDGATMSVDDMINEACAAPTACRRTSCAPRSWPARPARKNTEDNTPAVIHYSIVPGDKVEVDVAARRQLGEQVEDGHAPPVRLDRRLGAEDRTDHGRRLVPAGRTPASASAVPRRSSGDGEEVLMDPIDIHELRPAAAEPHRGTAPGGCSRRSASWASVPGPGRLTTVLDVKIMDYPTTPPRCRCA